jgi:hypothetical protein
MTPKNLQEHWGLIQWPWMVMTGHGVGLVVPLLFGSGFLIRVRQSSAVFQTRILPHTVAQISVPMFAYLPLKSILHNTS